MPSGADLVIIPAKQVVCKPHDTMRATANRFENDLVRQPQADLSVSVSLIIPQNGQRQFAGVSYRLSQPITDVSQIYSG